MAREELAFQTWCYVNGFKTPTDVARQAIKDAQEHGHHDELMAEGGMELTAFTPEHHVRVRHRLGISWTKSKVPFHQIKNVVHPSQMAVSTWKDVIVARDAYELPTIETVRRNGCFRCCCVCVLINVAVSTMPLDAGVCVLLCVGAG